MLIDTAGPVVGVAGYCGATCVHAEVEAVVAGADGWLTPALARAVAAVGSLDAVAVVNGPGAFTGLRVGLAHALGLALARGVPVQVLSSLALRAAAAPGRACVVALLDARKGRLYAQAFDTRGAAPLALGPPADAAAEVLAAQVWTQAVCVGEGVVVAGPLLACVPPWTVAPDAYVRAAAGLLLATPEVDAGDVGAAYLREPDATPPAAVAPPRLG